jgi:hypothetical protein
MIDARHLRAGQVLVYERTFTDDESTRSSDCPATRGDTAPSPTRTGGASCTGS